MSRISAAVIERIERLKSASKLSWIGVVNRLRTSSYAYKMGIDLGYRAGMRDPEAIVKYLEDNGLKEAREIAKDLWEKRSNLKYPPASLDEIAKEEFCAGFDYGVLIQQEKHNAVVNSLTKSNEKLHKAVINPVVLVDLKSLLVRMWGQLEAGSPLSEELREMIDRLEEV